jgi:hypothetical protein
LATWLLFYGLKLTNSSLTSAIEDGSVRQTNFQQTSWLGITSLIFSGLLYWSSFYHLYYQFVWDSTTDSIDFILLFGPLSAVCVSGVWLSLNLHTCRNLWYGLFFTVFLAVSVIAVYVIAKRTDYHLLTEKHAATVARAVDSYYARNERYPQSLHQLVPRTVVFLPKPVILHGQDWCYQSGDAYYRLGYVSRDRWSSPALMVKIYKSAGDIPDLPALCKEETEAIIAQDSIFGVADWGQ